MTFENYHRKIKRELIRSFALADQWIDKTFDLQFSNREVSKSTLHFLAVLTAEMKFLLDAISDYRFFEPDHDRDGPGAVFTGKHEVFRLGKIQAKPGVDLDELRQQLRDVLFECMLLLDLPDEKKDCEVILVLGEEVRIPVIDLIRIITEEITHRIDQLDAAPKNTA